MGGPAFQDGLAADTSVTERIGPDQMALLFDPMRQLQHIDATFERLGLDQKSTGDTAPQIADIEL